MKYEYRRTCKCGNVDFIEVNKREAAFSLREKEIWRMTCSKCGGTNTASLSHPQPEFTKDLLLEWGNNSDLFFMEQDEDLLLAEEKYVDLIFDVVDKHEILPSKRNVLMEAMCVIIFDTSRALEDETDKEKIQNLNQIKDRLIRELKERKQYVVDASGWIMAYIKDVVFPELGIEKK